MKRLILFLLVLVMSLSVLGGCVDDGNADNQGQTNNATTNTDNTKNDTDGNNNDNTNNNQSNNGNNDSDDDDQTVELPKDDVENLNDNKVRVFILAGQSNAVGVADTNDIPQGLQREFNDVLFYANGEPAQSGYNNSQNHNIWTTVQSGFGIHGGCSGSELGMASVLSQVYPKTDGKYKTAIIKYAWGGTGLAEQWLSENGYKMFASTGGASNYVDYNGNMVGNLYRNMMETISTAMTGLVNMGYEPEIKGMAWMQGCNDAWGANWATNYDSMLECMISDIRTNLNLPNLPVAIGEIGIIFSAYSDIIRDKQLKVGTTYPNCYFVSNNGLEMKVDDWWHFDSASIYQLGRRYVSQLLSSYRDFAVNQTLTVKQDSSVRTVYELPAFVEATTESGYQMPMEVTWGNYSSANATGKVNHTGVYKNCLGTVKAEVNVTNEPVVDGRIDYYGDKVWDSAKKNSFSQNTTHSVSNGSYFKLITTNNGIYVGGFMDDKDLFMNDWGEVWNNLVYSDSFMIYITNNADALNDKSVAIYLTISNTLSVYRGTSGGVWDGVEHYRTKNVADGYYSYMKHAVKLFGMPAFGDGSANTDYGYMFEIFIPYSSLGITYEQRNNIKINAAQMDAHGFSQSTDGGVTVTPPFHIIYKLNGGNEAAPEQDNVSATYKTLASLMN